MRERYFFCLFCVCFFNKRFFCCWCFLWYAGGWKAHIATTKGKVYYDSIIQQILTWTLISQISVELKWAFSVLDTGEEGHYGCCLGRAISPRHWWRSTLSGNLAYTKDVEGSLQLSLGCPKLDWFICWALLCLCQAWRSRKPDISTCQGVVGGLNGEPWP